MFRQTRVTRPTQIRYTASGALMLITPFNRDLIDAVKSLPIADRKWDVENKVWLVDPAHLDQLISWVDAFTGERISPPLPFAGNALGKKIYQVITLKYLGACKERADGSKAAFGLVDGEWKVIFSESILRLWFEGIEPEAEISSVSGGQSRTVTYYSILGIKKTASTDEIRAAFRRMAMQWHPDHCKEADAHDMFIRIKEASDILCDPSKRTRYDMGLELEKRYQAEQKRIEKKGKKFEKFEATYGYRAPLRCGVLLIEGTQKLDRIEVSKIYD